MPDSEQPHEVSMLRTCGDIEHCVLERYISDIRIAFAEIERLSHQPVDPELDAVMATL